MLFCDAFSLKIGASTIPLHSITVTAYGQAQYGVELSGVIVSGRVSNELSRLNT